MDQTSVFALSYAWRCHLRLNICPAVSRDASILSRRSYINYSADTNIVKSNAPYSKSSGHQWTKLVYLHRPMHGDVTCILTFAGRYA